MVDSEFQKAGRKATRSRKEREYGFESLGEGATMVKGGGSLDTVGEGRGYRVRM